MYPLHSPKVSDEDFVEDDVVTIADWHVVAEAVYPFEGANGFLRFKVCEACRSIPYM